MTAPLAVLRFPKVSAQAKSWYGVTTPDGSVVMALEVTQRGRQVDVTAPNGAPLGRIVEVRRRQWQLIAPGTGALLASAVASRRIQVQIGAGPPATVAGRGEEWNLTWEQTTLLAVRKVPRKVAKRCLDVYVVDPACTPAVVAFVVHVRRWVQAADASDQMMMQQLQTSMAPPPSY